MTEDPRMLDKREADVIHAAMWLRWKLQGRPVDPSNAPSHKNWRILPCPGCGVPSESATSRGRYCPRCVVERYAIKKRDYHRRVAAAKKEAAA